MPPRGRAGRWTALLTTATAVALAVAAFAGLRSTPERPVPGRAGPPPRSCGEQAPRPVGAPWWRADVEEGTLADWRLPGSAAGGAAGGGEFDSGSGRASASRAVARSGAWAARLVLPSGRGGTRLFRWQELRRHREAVLRVWLYLPRRYRLTAPGRTGRFWNVFQLKSRSRDGRNDPLWFVNLAAPARGDLRLELVWWHRTLGGPRPGQSGFRRFTQAVAAVPVGRWFELTARLRQSAGFDGVVCLWQDDHRLFSLHGIRTSFRACFHTSWCASNEWSVNNYSDGIAPAPAVLYADDASIAAR